MNVLVSVIMPNVMALSFSFNYMGTSTSQHNNTQHNRKRVCLLYKMNIMLGAIMLNVIVPNFMAPAVSHLILWAPQHPAKQYQA
jgi:hypothetical protein